MDDNYRKVLEMVAQGKVSVADAERLLEKLSKAPPAKKEEDGEDDGGKDDETPAKAKGKPKFLRVVVKDICGDHVNVRVPLTLVKTGVRLSALLPREAREAVEDQGVDLNGLSGLTGTDLLEALNDLELEKMDVDGSSVRIFCE